MWKVFFSRLSIIFDNNVICIFFSSFNCVGFKLSFALGKGSPFFHYRVPSNNLDSCLRYLTKSAYSSIYVSPILSYVWILAFLSRQIKQNWNVRIHLNKSFNIIMRLQSFSNCARARLSDISDNYLLFFSFVIFNQKSFIICYCLIIVMFVLELWVPLSITPILEWC